ncbi:MAG TPA: apolipoprotein N-acyltransferase [Balneolaceae bacterium]|nr:apolipoprotein N-acyltransferase [Balneolaceae bacterium]
MNTKIRSFWNNKWLLSIVAGILLGLSFPPFPFPFLEFPALIFILRLITLSKSARQAAYYSYPGFFIWNVIVSYWMMLASVIAGIAAILANAVLMSLIVMLQYFAQKKFKNGWIIALLQTAFWVSFEYLHLHWDLSWPWLSLGNAWANATAVIQYISATGYLGISFWVMFSSTLIYQIIRQPGKNLKIGASVVLLLFPVISLIQLAFLPASAKKTIHSEKKVQVVAAQPNFNTYKSNGGYATPQKALKHLFALSDSVRTSKTQLILWPESGIYPYITNRSARSYAARQVKKRLKKRAKTWNTTIIGGTGYLQYFPKNDHPPLPKWAGKIPYLTYNAAVGFYPNQTIKVYRKHNLVPVIERFPYVRFFNKIDVFGLINWASIQQFGEGHQPDQFNIDGTKVPVLICYDSIYPGWVRHFIQNGAGFISIITDDGWWGNTSGHIQHFDYARLRAIEFRRWVIQDSNNGTSGVITPDGSVKKRTRFGDRTAFRYNVPVLHKFTFYTRFGDWLPVSLLVISAISIVALIFSYFYPERWNSLGASP